MTSPVPSRTGVRARRTPCYGLYPIRRRTTPSTGSTPPDLDLADRGDVLGELPGGLPGDLDDLHDHGAGGDVADRQDLHLLGFVELLGDRGPVVEDPLDLEDAAVLRVPVDGAVARSEEHTSELQSLMRISYAVFC